MKKLRSALCFCLVIVFATSCHHSPNTALILGSWHAFQPKDSINFTMEFNEHGTAILKAPMMDGGGNDTMEYKLSDDGKKLTTTEKNGAVEELNIVELSKTDLILLKKSDSLHLKRN
jgi:hypothetical protein